MKVVFLTEENQQVKMWSCGAPALLIHLSHNSCTWGSKTMEEKSPKAVKIKNYDNNILNLFRHS